MMKLRFQLIGVLALAVLASYMCGCVSVYEFRPRATAVPVPGEDDPEQPLRPPDFSGLVVTVTYDSIVLQPQVRRQMRGDSEGAAATSALSDDSRKVEMNVPITQDVRIRQWRSKDAESMEYADIRLDEVIPGQYATVWLNGEGVAEYVRVSSRMRQKGEVRSKY